MRMTWARPHHECARSPIADKLFVRIYRLLWPRTPGNMRRRDSETNMRIDGLTGPELISAEACRRQLGARVANPGFHRRTISQTETTILAAELGALGCLEVSLTRDKRDIKRLQKLRYEIFYGHGRAICNLASRITRRDKDYFDGICDHLMVIDRSRRQWSASRPSVIGTYRLLRQDVAEKHGGFYSAGEFDIPTAPTPCGPAVSRARPLMRSTCLPVQARNRTIWHGVWSYVREHRIDVMIGCASFEGRTSRS